MKIAEVVANFPPYFGGIGNSCLQFSLGLKKMGHDVEVWTSRYPDIPFDYPDGLKVKRLKHQFKYGNAPLLLGLFKLKDVDVIHIHYPFYFGAEIIYLVSKFRKIPYVLTYHMDMVGGGVLKHIFNLHKKLFLKMIMKGAQRIYVTSQDYADHSDLASIKAIQDRIVEVPLGVDIDRFKPQEPSQRVRTILKLKPSDRVVLFIGQLDSPHYFKGVPVLLKAFAKIKNDNAKLLLIGDGNLRPSFEQQAKDLGIDNKVIFAGRVSDPDMNDFISIAEFSILPSTDKTEAFGMVLLEAQSAGRATIASNLPGVRSVVNENKDGVLITPNDVEDVKKKIEYMLKDENLTKKFGEAGRQKVESRYTWPGVSKLLSEDIRKFVINLR